METGLQSVRGGGYEMQSVASVKKLTVTIQLQMMISFQAAAVSQVLL